MNEDFRLTPDRQGTIPISELATLILRILQRNWAAPPGQDVVRYYAGSLSSIRAFEFLDESQYRLGRPNPEFRDRFAQAVETLRQRGFIYPDHTQSGNPDFVRLTDAGRAVDTTRPVLQVTTGAELLAYIERQAGRRPDPVSAAYLCEAFDTLMNGLPLSCAITLGVAAERLILRTADLIASHCANSRTEQARRGCRNVKETADFIVTCITDLRRRHTSHPEAFGDLDTKIKTLYGFYRLVRNEAGHPEDTVLQLRSEVLRANLESFLEFTISVLRVWLVIESQVAE